MSWWRYEHGLDDVPGYLVSEMGELDPMEMVADAGLNLGREVP